MTGPRNDCAAPAPHGGAKSRLLRGCVAVGAASFLLLSHGPAVADAPVAVGWWWSGRPTSAVPAIVAPPVSVPEGGLYVASDATGPAGVAALRFDVTTSDALLEMSIVDAIGEPALTACLADAPWQPVERGAWDIRPRARCDLGSSIGQLGTGGALISFDLRSLAVDRPLDLILLPGPDPVTGRPATFAVALAPPGTDALRVTAAPEPDRSVERSPSSSPRVPPSATGSVLPPPRPAAPSMPTAQLPESIADGDLPASVRPVAPRVSAVPVSNPREERFAYPAVIALPMVLLAVAAYLGWSLNQPVLVSIRPKEA